MVLSAWSLEPIPCEGTHHTGVAVAQGSRARGVEQAPLLQEVNYVYNYRESNLS
jgi:hypothetical protein